jgi:hypothetical protein
MIVTFWENFGRLAFADQTSKREIEHLFIGLGLFIPQSYSEAKDLPGYF